MIKIEDISCGLWFEFSPKQGLFLDGQVCGIDYENKKVKLRRFDEIYEVSIYSRDGIEVTEETIIFSKLEPEFERILKRTEYSGWVGKYHVIISYWGEESNLRDKPWGIHIDNNVFETAGAGCFGYVHEFQKLVNSITGEFLELKGFEEFIWNIECADKYYIKDLIPDVKDWRVLDVVESSESVSEFVKSYMPRFYEFFKDNVEFGQYDILEDLYLIFEKYLTEYLYHWTTFEKDVDHTEEINRDFIRFLISYCVCSNDKQPYKKLLKILSL